ALQDPDGDQAARAVPAVCHDAQRPGEREAARDVRDVLGQDVVPLSPPAPTSNSSPSIRSRSRWMAAPYSARPSMIILNPLYSGGLCEPVIWIPPSVSRRIAAK